MPPVVADDLLVGELLVRIEREHDFGHLLSFDSTFAAAGMRSRLRDARATAARAPSRTRRVREIADPWRGQLWLSATV
ncbi:hypothetical protein PA7_03620 [Pseudonocardia asaccharolytica DSM 44247 = NBRC 16224]|uniref:Uncharacterized protein n=1 Tax=Pseudonocardia asaccharolytica DSM 44247 = NBRC 16224 TaxID=1123024 RepID=A0A511CVB9_9PSEU|nr:hypothetical protein PA7_03620 [Pseudonocardia asaccharolytica DSM 44247 = NBRC 16224]